MTFRRPPRPQSLPSPIKPVGPDDWSGNTPERCAWYAALAASLDDDELIEYYVEFEMFALRHPLNCCEIAFRHEATARGLKLPL